jgi:hypothetical protein
MDEDDDYGSYDSSDDRSDMLCASPSADPFLSDSPARRPSSLLLPWLGVSMPEYRSMMSDDTPISYMSRIAFVNVLQGSLNDSFDQSGFSVSAAP